MRILTFLGLIVSAMVFADERFTTSVNWEAIDETGPRKPTIRSVSWRMSDDARTLAVIDPENGDLVILRLLGSKPGTSSHGVLFAGPRDSSGRTVIVNLIGGPLSNITTINYSVTVKHGAKERMFYGNASSELERCFWRLK